MRFLGPAALTAASLVLLLATDGSVADLGSALDAAPDPARAAAVATLGGRPAGDPGAVPGAVPGSIPPVELAAAEVAHAAPPAAVPPQAVPPQPVKLARRVLADPGWTERREQLPRQLFAGAGFDACSAPALDTLKAWRGTSPYGAVGIYISGAQRACDQSRLTADWVRQAQAMGWKLIPTHVGLQAPCSRLARKPHHIDPARATQQGRDEAATAVRALKSLGLRTGSPVYLDIEAYPRGDRACSQAVVDFAQGWTQALHKAGYYAGFYSSTDAGIADLAAAARAGSSPLPDAVWYARWDDRPTTTDGAGALGGDLWALHQRIHQHHGNVQESYGGAALTIDRDQLDAVVAR
ncbi:hypothetical protein GCM10010441_55360 [Kitasatospora paracochleata]|uniref:Rv2525c-like glycoside hydrolase-like domain-containing protein n=1 Tax=Kitasatospora paracochleata TaxID=58354 RepID=A0ABT1J6F0_9ACTN|nr:DUF1906 domain-containing protein [Kitasatospora paracochleata]MCP2313013.1 hypothetical protein [Kitasatospora paracochleata]